MTQRAGYAAGSAPAPSALRRYVHRFAYAREYVVIAGLFVGVVAGLSLATCVGLAVLSSVRAYTNAEALYSKAQKDAVYYLHQYAYTGQSEYFQKYRAAIAVPLGYRQARVELEKAAPDPEVVRQGLLQGRSHPADAAVGPIWMFRLVRRLGPARRAFRLWSEADLLVAQLENVAALLRAEVASGDPDASRRTALLQEIERINVNLTTLEETFSGTLGDAARAVRRFVLQSLGVAALLLLGLGLLPSWRMLKRLKDSEDKFRRLFEQSRDAIALVRLDGQVAYANPAAFDLFDYPPAAPGQPADEVRVEDFFAEAAGREKLLRRIRREGFVENYEVPLRRRDGVVLDCLVTATRIRDRRGRVVGFECLLRDISRRKATERRMRLLERAVEASGNVILISDATRPDYPLVYVNPAFERLTDFPAEEAIGRNGFFLLEADPAACERTLEVLRRALLEETESRVVLRNVRKDGRPFWNELSIAPVYDADGRLVNYVGIQTDVTEIKEAEEALKKALAKEKELSEIQARFVSMASHEFRTPLATILSSAELVERFRHQWEDGRTLKHLQRIQNSVQALTELLENVLLVGKVEAGRLRFQPVDVELGAFCRELVEEVWMGHGQGRRIEVRLPEAPLVVQADPPLLRSMLSNLLTNAAKYSPADGVVVFSLARDAGRAVFRVADEGIGIPAEDLRQVAEPFHRAGNAETIPGTGLGLSIAQRAVELHGGTLTIESEEGRGTLVAVSIPLVARPAAQAAKV